MEHEAVILITIVAAVGFGLLAQILAHRWRIPAIVLLLGFGILLGENALGIVRPHELGNGLGILVKLAVAIILFEGALNLNLKSLRLCAVEIRNLVTIGVIISWGVTTLIAHYIAGFEWQIAILFGALMTVTGPTVVQPLLRRISVSRSLKTVLEGEAILIDPIGAILAIAVLDVLLATTTRGTTGITQLLWAYFGRLLVGGIIGTLGALGLTRLMKASHLVPEELSNLVALAGVWVTFGIAESLQAEAGIMAAVAMGLVMQSKAVPGIRNLRRFKETLTTLGISMLFILLAANLEITSLVSEGYSGIIAVVMIMLIARPLAVFLSTWRTQLDWRRKVFIAWVGPRGIIAASVASIFMIALDDAGLAGGQRLLALTFLTIIMTVTFQGLSAGWLARLLGLQEMGGEKAIVIGANKLALAISLILKENSRPALLVDTNRSSVERARMAGLDAIDGNALEEEVLEEIHAEEYATFLAVTSNSEVNVLACQIAQDAFGIKRAFPAMSNPAKGANPTLLKITGGRLAFGHFIDISEWEGWKEIHEIAWQIPESRPVSKAGDLSISGEILPILRVRRNSAEIVHAGQDWQAGDRIIFITNQRLDAAKKILNQIA
jgi:NhaP-type Na+/H+ or K+/H+ antiporter